MTDRRFESIGNILNKPRPNQQRPDPRQTTETAAPGVQAEPVADKTQAAKTDDVAQTDGRDAGKPTVAKKAAQARSGAAAVDRQPAAVFSIHPGRRTQTEAQPKSTSTPVVDQRASRTADGGARRIALRLDPGLHAALAAEATRQQSSHGNVVLTALERAHAADAFTNQTGDLGENETSLFPRLQTRRNAQPTVLAEIRLHARAVATIDDLVVNHQLGSRTELITKALRWHLENRHDPHQDGRQDQQGSHDGHEATAN